MDLPCTYCFLITVVFLIIVKLRLGAGLSLVMTSLSLCSVYILPSLAYSGYQNLQLYQECPNFMHSIQLIAPVLCLIVQYISNIWMCSVHQAVFSNSGLLVSPMIYFPSLCFSYHWLSQVKIK